MDEIKQLEAKLDDVLDTVTDKLKAMKDEVVDGHKLTDEKIAQAVTDMKKANDDYFIDYDAGIVTLYNEDQVKENTIIDISYDYAPFGSTGSSTLVGVRSELSLTENIFVGSSFIYEFASITKSVPDIRTTPTSLMVSEVDSRIQNIKIPGTPIARIFPKRISAPSSTRPVLMKYSVWTAGFTHSGVPTVLLISRPKRIAQAA